MVATQEGAVVDLVPTQPTVLTVQPADLDGIAEALAAYHAAFVPCFRQRTQRVWSEVYLRGLLVAEVPRKNVEAVALRLLGAGEAADRQVRALQHFVGEGRWDDAAVLRQHWRLVEASLGEEGGVLMVDGSDIPKQGTHSAGVARQWCGALGKKANCPAGVFVGYASGQGYTLLDRRLYLPELWFSDAYRERWRQAAIPPETPFATKPALAAAMVEGIVASGLLRARWLTCDEGYGDDPAFLDRVAACGLWYLAEVSRSTHVWPLTTPTGQPAASPQVGIPPQTTSRRGPAPRRVRLHPESPSKQAVEAWAAAVPAAAWQRFRVLEGAKGPLLADFAAVRVVAVRDRLPGPTVWLVIRRTIPAAGEAPVCKYYLSHAPDDVPLRTLVRASGMRWPIERCFTEGKDELGLDHYECRFWRGWHHHLTLVILAHHFLVQLQRQLHQRAGGLRPPDGTAAGSHPAAARPGRLACPPAAGARLTQPDAGAPAPARHPPAARVRSPRRGLPDRLPAATQTGSLPLPSHQAVAARSGSAAGGPLRPGASAWHRA